ncbi:MAG: 4Fe-4S binding protein [Halofilum sp. (in: g-proteobacteria)]|nr:4Fe-4S binding protein [Halofilum sp. (in: g-proteobacteria)]
MLTGLGWPADRLAVLDIGGDETPLAEAPGPLVAEPATFAGLGGKRARLRQAITHLYRQAGGDAPAHALTPGAPLGAIEVDGDACTLCMACVSVCPTQAVVGGGESPQLRFHEERCTQCGLCERTCPEDAITLAPQVDYAAQAEPGERVLHEEPMHHCPGCGKAFATRKLIERMEQRLAGHWMFADDTARRRLQLCEDCRVEAVMRDEGSLHPYK